MATQFLSIYIHHGGNFSTDDGGRKKYSGGAIEVWHAVDEDTLDVFSFKKFAEALGYLNVKQVYWLDPGHTFFEGLRMLELDADLLDMVRVAKLNDRKMDVYYEHWVSEVDESSLPKLLPAPDVGGSQSTDIAYMDDVGGVSDTHANVQSGGSVGSPIQRGRRIKRTRQSGRLVRIINEGCDDVEDDVDDGGADKGGGEKTGADKGGGEKTGAEVCQKGGIDIGADSGAEVFDKGGADGSSQSKEGGEKGDVEGVEKDGAETQGAEGGSQTKEGKKKSNRGGKKGKKKGKAVIVEDDLNINLSAGTAGHHAADSWVSEELNTPVNSENEGESKGAYPQYSEGAQYGEVELELGMEFPSLEAFKAALKDYSIHLGRDIKWVKNDKERVRARCKGTSCTWEIFCSISNAQHCYQIKTFNKEHTCGRVFKNKLASQDWVTEKLLKKLKKGTEMRPCEVRDMFKEEYGLHLHESKIVRCIQDAQAILQGTAKEQYGLLWDYCEELRRANPGSTIKMDTLPQPDGSILFDRVYICLEGCKRGFKEGCRPLIGLDGAFVKSYHGGQLLSAVGQDANNHIWVIAYAVVQIENKDNWKWFLGHLHGDLGDYRQHKWNFISDMQKGLIQAIQDVMLGAPHRFCVWHLWQNFSKHWKDRKLRFALWECARARTVNDFQRKMETLKSLDTKAYDYLAGKPKEAWCKAYFSTWTKVDNICNNNCEVFNAKIVGAREKPIVSMLEEIRVFILNTISNNKLKLDRHVGHLPPVQQSRLEREKKESNKWTAQWSGDDDGFRFEVECWPHRVAVNLGTQSCTCRFWDLTGMPCCHAIAAIAYKNERPEDHCNGWLTMASYMQTYKHHIQPLPGKEFWQPTPFVKPLPPHFKKRTGRPKKNRKKDPIAEQNSQPHKLKRNPKQFQCSVCGQPNHNRQSCPKAKRQKLEQMQAQQPNPTQQTGGPTAVGPQPNPTQQTAGPSTQAGGPTIAGPQPNPTQQTAGPSTQAGGPTVAGPQPNPTQQTASTIVGSQTTPTPQPNLPGLAATPTPTSATAPAQRGRPMRPKMGLRPRLKKLPGGQP